MERPDIAMTILELHNVGQTIAEVSLLQVHRRVLLLQSNVAEKFSMIIIIMQFNMLISFGAGGEKHETIMYPCATSYICSITFYNPANLC